MEDFPGGPILKPPGIAPLKNRTERLCLGVGLIWVISVLKLKNNIQTL